MLSWLVENGFEKNLFFDTFGILSICLFFTNGRLKKEYIRLFCSKISTSSLRFINSKISNHDSIFKKTACCVCSAFIVFSSHEFSGEISIARRIKKS